MSGNDHGSIPLGLQRKHKSFAPEDLEMMGKRAAVMYRDQGVPLTDAVVRSIGSDPLSPEHVKRVVEFANTAAYLDAFEKSGSIRNVTFEGGPADVSVALKQLNTGSHPTEYNSVDRSYSGVPEPYSTASDSDLREMFYVKTAAYIPRAEPVGELVRMRDRLRGAGDHLMSKLSGLNVMYDDLAELISYEARREINEGSSVEKIASAWASVGKNDYLVKLALYEVRDRLTRNGFMDKPSFDNGVEKVAAFALRVPNPKHPLIGSYLDFEKVAEQRLVTEKAVQEITEQVGKVTETIGSMS